jgi:hypothetical protein
MHWLLSLDAKYESCRRHLILFSGMYNGLKPVVTTFIEPMALLGEDFKQTYAQKSNAHTKPHRTYYNIH